VLAVGLIILVIAMDKFTTQTPTMIELRLSNSTAAAAAEIACC
jgi:hypothetical protein